MSATDVVVIGAGVVGAAIADVLARNGVRVTVVEQQFAGAGSTGAAMGHLVVMDDSVAQLRLCHLSRLRWEAMQGDLPGSAEFDQTGTLWLAATDDEMTAAATKVAAFRREGVAAELLDAAALAEAEPALAAGLRGALRIPGDAVCYPPSIARALLDRAMAHGAVERRAMVRAISEAGVELSDGSTLGAEAVVVAAGAHSAAIVPGLPVMPRRGHLCITDRLPWRVHHQLVELGYLHTAHTLGGASVAFNAQPRRSGQLLIGSSRELVDFDPVLNRPLLGRMLSRATSFLPALATAPLSRSWVGYRPATVDALPLIGRWPALPRTWVATGHEGLGITMAPGTAELIAAALLERTPPIDPAPYRPDRPIPASEGTA